MYTENVLFAISVMCVYPYCYLKLVSKRMQMLVQAGNVLSRRQEQQKANILLTWKVNISRGRAEASERKVTTSFCFISFVLSEFLLCMYYF